MRQQRMSLLLRQLGLVQVQLLVQRRVEQRLEQRLEQVQELGQP